jgi:hypothetical protein
MENPFAPYAPASWGVTTGAVGASLDRHQELGAGVSQIVAGRQNRVEC